MSNARAVVLSSCSLLLISGCAIGAGRIDPSVGGRVEHETDVTGAEPTGGKTFVMQDGHAVLANEYSGGTTSSYETSTAEIPFGVATGMKLGFGHVSVNGRSASATNRDYFFEAAYRNPGRFALAVEGGYTHLATDDIEQDSTFSGWYLMGRLALPLGPFSIYGTGGKAWTAYGNSLGQEIDAHVYRVGGGLMFWLPVSFVDLVPRIEALAMPSAGGDVTASGSVVQGTLAFMF